MNNEEYDKLINKYIKEENTIKNVFISFFSGGVMGLSGQLITDMFLKYFVSNESDAYTLTFFVFVIVGSILTGLGFFDKILSFCRCGLIVPSTGFANTMTSSAMDYKNEGFIKGIGGNIFKLTGSIILYGIIFGLLFGYIRSVI